MGGVHVAHDCQVPPTHTRPPPALALPSLMLTWRETSLDKASDNKAHMRRARCAAAAAAAASLQIGDGTVISNAVMLAGHVRVGDGAVIGGARALGAAASAFPAANDPAGHSGNLSQPQGRRIMALPACDLPPPPPWLRCSSV